MTCYWEHLTMSSPHHQRRSGQRTCSWRWPPPSWCWWSWSPSPPSSMSSCQTGNSNITQHFTLGTTGPQVWNRHWKGKSLDLQFHKDQSFLVQGRGGDTPEYLYERIKHIIFIWKEVRETQWQLHEAPILPRGCPVHPMRGGTWRRGAHNSRRMNVSVISFNR